MDVKSSRDAEFSNKIAALQINTDHPVKPFQTDELKLTSFSVSVPYDMQDNSLCNVKVMSHESPVGNEVAEIAYEGEDEHEENISIKREFSDFDLQAHVTNSGEEEVDPSNRKSGCFDSIDKAVNGQFKNKDEKGNEKGVDIIQSGHVSDPGIGKAEFWASPKLQRSCSNLETRVVLRKIADQLPPSKSESYDELQELASKLRQNFDPGSPGSVKSHLSADRVMLKKHSSSQILPSRSRRLWWKLFLWSHRNLHKPWISRRQPVPIVAAQKQQGGYSSDTLEPNRGMNSGKVLSPGSYTDESLNKGWSGNYNNCNRSWDGFDNGISAFWPHNQWVAFQPESASFKRVDEWVKGLETPTPIPVVDDEGFVFPPSHDTGKSPARSTAHLTYRTDINLPVEVLHANSVIQSLNSSSTVAHIAGIGLKAIPTISRFSGLRTVNLSNNFIGMSWHFDSIKSSFS